MRVCKSPNTKEFYCNAVSRAVVPMWQSSGSRDWAVVNTQNPGQATELGILVGIELGCACCRRRVTTLVLSVARCHGHVFRSPPIMPDGRISQVRLEVLAFRG